MPSWRHALALTRLAGGVAAPLAILTACSPVEVLEEVRPKAPEEQPFRVERGEGWALRVPTGAKVVATGSEVRVDSPEGRWWFDVRWVDTDPALPHAVSPIQTATSWAEERCRPIRWDIPASPVPGTLTAGGFCTIGHRDHWVLVAIEDHPGGRRLLTGMIAESSRVPYEDLWVTWVETALTLTAADEPRPLLTPDQVRERMREAQRVRQGDIAAGQLPRPGGGMLSKVVSEAFGADLWRARRRVPLPTAMPPRPSEPPVR